MTTTITEQEAREAKQGSSVALRGKDIRRSRRENNVSLSQLAALSNLSVSTLSRFESGQRDISASAYARLLNILRNKTVMRRRLAEHNQQRSAELATRKAERRGEPVMRVSDLAGGKRSFDAYIKGCERMQQEYGPHWREVFKAFIELGEAKAENRDLKQRLAELRDLLHLETKAAIKRDEIVTADLESGS